MSELRNHANLIWGIAELLRGDYKQAQYGRVILPLVVMRRLDQALEDRKDAVVARAAQLEAQGIQNIEPALLQVAGQQFYNRSPLRFHQLLDEPQRIAHTLQAYIDGYSRLAREVIDNFEFEREIEKLHKADLVYQCVARICEVDLHPDRVSNLEMGCLFEELIRKFAEQSNETAGEHFTPREVVRLMVNLLLAGDSEALREPGIIRTVFDCACGTGGMLSEAQDEIAQLNPKATVHVYGQELNPESYAICLADMLVKGTDASHIVLGNSLSNDGHQGEGFHYCIANPPFGVDWSKVEREIRDEHEQLGFDGRFGPGLPRKSDGQLLFLLHLISKMRDPEHGGSRVAIVHNGSPLTTGGPGSGESEIRRFVLENDLLEAIIALPDQLFYNTGIASYIWLLSNRKADERVGKVQLIDARGMWTKLRKSLGEKRREIAPDQASEILRLHEAFADGDLVKIVTNKFFGYRAVVVERPLRAEWLTGPDRWDFLPKAKAVDQLAPDQAGRLQATLQATAGARYSSAEECQAALKKVVEAVVPAPTPSLLKALTAACMVRSPEAPIARKRNGSPIDDPDLRDVELVPLTEELDSYFQRTVVPEAPDAWIAERETRIGFEVPLTKLFFEPKRVRPSHEIKQELVETERSLRALMEEVLM